ncbi:MAG TPA: hypothetical protein VFA47_10595 [Candidatus Manganitrophaceae bacterium]|nr:hypothetical protein [Candidatus Manganitrophaceae bacterium]
MASTVSEQPIRAAHPVPLDIILFGFVMVLSGVMDTYIIVANPEYGLPVFGMKLTGPIGWFFKFLSPTLHFTSGYGAIMGRRWAYPLFMLYSVYGLLSAIVSWMVLPPPHRIRKIFIVILMGVMGYLYLRRDQFRN